MKSFKNLTIIISICLIALSVRKRICFLIGEQRKDNWLIDLFEVCNNPSFYNRFKSPGSQDLYLYHIFHKIGITNRYFVEFGFSKPSYTRRGSRTNTWNLYDEDWRGLLLDGKNKYSNREINLHAHFLFHDNIAKLFKRYKVPRYFDFLSCDLDSHDLFVVEGILKDGYRPRVITTEYNSNYPLDFEITLLDPTLRKEGDFNFEFVFKHCAWGSSASALRIVLEKYNYTLVGRVGSLDLVWVQNSLLQKEWEIPCFEWFFNNINKRQKSTIKNLGDLSHSKQSDPSIFEELMDYRVYMDTGDIDVAIKAAKEKIKNSTLDCFSEIQRK